MRSVLNNDIAFSLLRAGCAVGFTILMVLLMLRPELQTIAGIRVLKIASEYHVSLFGHMVMFGLMFLLWCWALIPHFLPSSAPFFACLITLMLGVMGEFLQTFIPGRYASAADMLANIAGITIAWWAWHSIALTMTTRFELLLKSA